jgi:hypothetical protein
MPFKTPEEFFLGQITEPASMGFDPMSFVKTDLEEPGMCCLVTSNELDIPRKKPTSGGLLTGLHHSQTLYSQAPT